MRHTTRPFAAVILFAAVATSALGEVEGLLEQLRGQDTPTRQRARRAIRDQHHALVQRLIGLAGETTPADQRSPGPGQVPSHRHDEPKDLAIALLGDLRAADAVPVLFRNLKYYNPPAFVWSAGDPAPDFPVAVSLAKIGKPSVRPAIHKLATTDDEVERELCCWIIQQVEGKQLAPIVLQLAIDKEQYSGRKKRLQAALDYLQKQE